MEWWEEAEGDTEISIKSHPEHKIIMTTLYSLWLYSKSLPMHFISIP